jgi:zinc protease
VTPLDRSRPPRPGAVPPFRFPRFERSRLKNGLDVFIAVWPRFPLLNMQILIPAGGRYDRVETAGLASFHASLLDEGTKRRTAPQIAAAIEELGGYLGTGSDWNVASVGLSLLSRHRDAGLGLMAEILRSPTFPEEEIKRLKRQRLAEILRRKSLPSVLAHRFFAHAVFADTIFAEPLVGTVETVEPLRREHILDFYRRRLDVAGSTFIAVGDCDPDELLERLEETFGDWSSRGEETPPLAEPTPLSDLRIHVVDRPGSTQAQLQMGHLGLRRNHEDHPRATLMNALLGGTFTGRINLSLRERHGITYGAYSQLSYRQGPGVFAVKAAVQTEAVGLAVREVLREMRFLRQELVDEESLRGCQDFLVGAFPTTLQTVADIARRLEDLKVFELDDDYFTRYPEVLRHVTREDVREAARRYLDPERIAVVVVGEADVLVPQLRELGEVEVYVP